jgi:hypothetical protein
MSPGTPPRRAQGSKCRARSSFSRAASTGRSGAVRIALKHYSESGRETTWERTLQVRDGRFLLRAMEGDWFKAVAGTLGGRSVRMDGVGWLVGDDVPVVLEGRFSDLELHVVDARDGEHLDGVTVVRLAPRSRIPGGSIPSFTRI